MENKSTTKCYCGHTTYCDCSPLEEPKDNNHSVDANEMIEDDVEKLAEISSELQEATYTPPHKTTYKHGFIDGYNKAKETLYTEEQVIEIVEKSRATGLTAEYIIQLLKQPKQ